MLEYFDFIVQTFYPATGGAVRKIIGDDVHSVFQRRQEFIEASQSAVFDLGHPAAQRLAARFFRMLLVIKQARPFLAQPIGLP